MTSDKKLFYKVYQSKDFLDTFFVERPEDVPKSCGLENYEDYLINKEHYQIPVLEPIFMTEQEFKDLPEFDGY